MPGGVGDRLAGDPHHGIGVRRREYDLAGRRSSSGAAPNRFAASPAASADSSSTVGRAWSRRPADRQPGLPLRALGGAAQAAQRLLLDTAVEVG